MKRHLSSWTGAVALAGLVAAAVATDALAQPVYYGRIDGSFLQPQVVYPEPLMIQPAPPGVVRQPVYYYVPEKQAKAWRKYCKKYKACGQPVYFVQENWYRDVYVPEYRDAKGKVKKEKKEKKPKKDKDG